MQIQGDTSMPPPTAAQTSFALARLEELHSMLALNEAVEILTGKKLPLAQRIRKKAETLCLDIGYATTAPIRKTVDAIDGELMFLEIELECFYGAVKRPGLSRSWG
jgi:hypothetical protein